MKQINIEAERLRADTIAAANLARSDKFVYYASQMHHLVSTAAQPGIFSSPFGPDKTAIAFGAPVEDHIRTIFRACLPL